MTDRTCPPWDNLPHGDEINVLLDALRDLTDAEACAMAAAWDAALGAWNAVRTASLDAARTAERDDVWNAAWSAAWDAPRHAARGAARDAALALVVADLVGQYGLTRDHLDILTGPARTIPRLASIIDRALSMKEN